MRIRTGKDPTDDDQIKPIAPIVLKCVQAIGTVIWKCSKKIGDNPDDRDDHDQWISGRFGRSGRFKTVPEGSMFFHGFKMAP